jgi:large subunit ribosomal protein L6
MSRIGKQPVVVPSGVKIEVAGQTITASGKLGKQTLRIHPEVAVKMEGDKVVLAPRSMSKRTRALWGTNRALLNNMVTGVATGFSQNLEINGVGYRASLEGKALNLQLGFSHDVKYPLPEGVSVKIGEKQAAIAITGADRRLVGQVAAEIRAFRKPEPYKGKGIKYSTEKIRRKEGKKK